MGIESLWKSNFEGMGNSANSICLTITSLEFSMTAWDVVWKQMM